MTNVTTGRRIAVVGTTGSGKTTLARQLAQRFSIPHVELDALFWEPNWTQASLDVFRARTDQALSSNAWVADGNYSKVRDIVWVRATTLIWLDYSLALTLARLIRRTVRRTLTKEPLWNTNQESIRNALLSKDSLIQWAIRTHGQYRRLFAATLTQPAYAHLAVVHLHSPREAREWLETLALVPAGEYMITPQ